MSLDGYLAASAEADLQRALLAALRADPTVQAVFGAPARVFDDETRGAAYPYAVFERHETRPAGAATVEGQEHILTFAVLSRDGGRGEAREALGALRLAVERATLAIDGQTVVLVQPLYADVFRTNDRRRFRGLLRVRIITEEAAP